MVCFMFFPHPQTILSLEPTSALDTEAASAVEKCLVNQIHASDSLLKATVWITHSPEQGRRVGTRFVSIQNGVCSEDYSRDVEHEDA